MSHFAFAYLRTAAVVAESRSRKGSGMLSSFRRKWPTLAKYAFVGCVSLGLGAASANAQQVPGPASSDQAVLAEMKARLDRLEQANQHLTQQNQQLVELLQQQKPVQPAGLQGGGSNEETKKVVLSVLKEQDDKKKAADEAKKKEAAEKGYEVGSDTKLLGAFGNGFIFESENKDFRLHVGGGMQFDSVWFQQPSNMHGAAPGGNTGVVGSSGLGQLDDGSFFRRARLYTDGVMYEVVEFNLETAFENINNVIFQDFWVGVKDVPWLGTIRIGQVKTPIGLESISSSKFLPLLERSPLFDTFWQEFSAGLYITNTAFDQHMTWHYAFTRQQFAQNGDGASFGDGEYQHTARLTFLPVWECNGREFLHIGGAYQFHTGALGRDSGFPGTGTGAFNDSQELARFRTRMSQRDAIGTLAGSTVSGSILGNGARILDTGNIIANDGVHTVAAELMYNHGPFWIQSEYSAAYVPDGRYPATLAGNTVSRGTPCFWGAYFMAGYFLTGEQRGYDRRIGRYDRIIPNENFFAVKDEDGSFNHGTGAWEVVYRYSHLDLNDNGINGGLLNEHTVGLNWYLTPNFKLQFQYGVADRNVPAPAVSGQIQFAGLRAAVDF